MTYRTSPHLAIKVLDISTGCRTDVQVRAVTSSASINTLESSIRGRSVFVSMMRDAYSPTKENDLQFKVKCITPYHIGFYLTAESGARLSTQLGCLVIKCFCLLEGHMTSQREDFHHTSNASGAKLRSNKTGWILVQEKTNRSGTGSWCCTGDSLKDESY